MLRHGYWLFEFVSISEIILKAPVKYGEAFLYTETDQNDLTYFIIHQIEVIRRSIQSLHRYINRKAMELNEVESFVKRGNFNYRQEAILAHAYRFDKSSQRERWVLAGVRTSVASKSPGYIELQYVEPGTGETSSASFERLGPYRFFSLHVNLDYFLKS